MLYTYTAVISESDGTFYAKVPDVSGCITTASSLSEAIKLITDALNLCLVELMIYPAIFYPESDGQFSVIIPDLNDLATYGDSFADAFSMAQCACSQYLFTSLRDEESLPSSTPLCSIKRDDPASIVALVYVNLNEYATRKSG